MPLIDIGFASIKLQGYSYGRFSAVYSAVKNDTSREEVVVKVFSGGDGGDGGGGRGVAMRDNETLIL